MKQLLTITLLLLFLSCGQNSKSNRRDLLTSSIWTIEKASVETLFGRDGDFPKMFEKYKFLTDGTCLLITGETEIYGKWSWAKNDEIYIKPEGTVLNGQKIKADLSIYGLNIKIVELTDKIFRTLEKGEADNWGSGIIIEGNYTALSL
ncbi:MAG: hypothetical protein AABY93_13755 [Bacteroidota bacterium]